MPVKERSIRAVGVILRHSNFGEADRLLTIFTREMGKVRAIAKGVRKTRSRKAGHVEPFTRSNLQLARGRDLMILTQVEAIDVHPNFRDDLVLLGYASYLIELLDRATYDEEENRPLYNLIARSLTRLDRGDDPNLVSRYYELRLLDYVGFRPQLFTCTQCKNEIQPEDQFFSAVRGGVLCPKCGQRDPDARRISMLTLKFLRHLQRSSYREAARATISPTVYNEMEILMYYYLTHTLERGLNTPSFLRRVRQEQSKKSDQGF
jgi:DNA repair protein RecO (recombination protein O)